jgi:hypothetical protein
MATIAELLSRYPTFDKEEDKPVEIEKKSLTEDSQSPLTTQKTSRQKRSPRTSKQKAQE